MIRSKLLFLAGLCFAMAPIALGQAPTIQNSTFEATVRPKDGSYEIFSKALHRTILTSRVGAEINQGWLFSTDYPHHKAAISFFKGVLGEGYKLTITHTGLPGKPDLICQVRLYKNRAYGELSVQVENTAGSPLAVNSLRVADAVGLPRIALGAGEQDDRVLAESFSEDPTIHIGGLASAPHGIYCGVNNILIYNLKSQQGLLLAALTSNRFLTVSHLKTASKSKIDSFTVDSTGTTEGVLERDEISRGQQLQLSLPVAPGAKLASERVLFSSGASYLELLEDYGKAVRLLHHVWIAKPAPMGWWSWTAFYGGITAGDVLTNALWQARRLLPLGYNFLQIDEGYQYARGEYTTANATQFPAGMWGLAHQIAGQGLVFGLWTAPFEVSERAWVYQHHPEWLVKDAQGKPIQIGRVEETHDHLYVLDTTHPGAQGYLRETYRVLAREFGARYFKLDFMDSSAVEGYHYVPNTTALEAQRIGLKIIRQAVGEDVLLDKDGSPMLSPVGIVDEGRISVDTGHSFEASKDAAPNIAARFYMNRNFYISDPDAFSVSRQIEPQQTWHESKKGLSLNEAQVQIVLAAMAGGMYEVGDDLPTLGTEKNRLALVENKELIAMNRLGRAALPLDLMTFRSQDEQPSVFFLKEDNHQSMLAVFNWTDHPSSHEFSLGSLQLAAGHSFQAEDVLNSDAPVAMDGTTLRLENIPAHSVRLIKFVDTSVPAAAPTISAHVPSTVHAGDSIRFSAHASRTSVPALGYHWNFGDGTAAEGDEVQHTYTLAGTFQVQLMVTGIDGIPARQEFTLHATGFPNTSFHLKQNRRYLGPE
jgi:alpha-galactosidase